MGKKVRMDEMHEEFKILGYVYKDFKNNLGQKFSNYETIELFKLMIKKMGSMKK